MNPAPVSVPASVDEDSIVQETTIRASAERIFEALTAPEELLKWWSSEGRFQILQAESDLRPGGRWSMRLMGRCSGETPETLVHGVYRTIERPRLLIFTWIREGEDLPETTVRWDLEEAGDVTRVRVTHSGLVSERLRARNGGWPLIVTILQAYMEKPALE